MTQKHDSESPDEYFAKLEERQRHQYDPGYYTGGRMRPIFGDNAHPRLFGWLLIMGSSIYLIMMLVSTLMQFSSEHVLSNVLGVLPVAGIMVLFLLAGLRLVKKGKP